MNVNLQNLMDLVESTQYGGQVEMKDLYPYMSMSEAAAMIPAECIKSQAELSECTYETTVKTINIMVESANLGLNYENEVVSLQEASFANIKDRIVAFFKRIGDMIMSVIKKIRSKISDVINNTKIMMNKNKDIKEDKLKALKFEGYDLSSAEMPGYKDSIVSDGTIKDNLTKIGFPAPQDLAKVVANVNDDAGAERMTQELHNIQNISAEDRRANYVEAVTGKKTTDPDWTSAIYREVIGQKSEMTYGTGMFKLATVKEILSSAKDLKKVEDSYNTLLKSMKKHSAEVSKAADAAAKANAKNPTHTGSLINLYFSEYMKQYQEQISVVSAMQSVRMRYGNLRISQAKSMFLAMIKASKAKDEE